jgi:hypothetical protein
MRCLSQIQSRGAHIPTACQRFYAATPICGYDRMVGFMIA